MSPRVKADNWQSCRRRERNPRRGKSCINEYNVEQARVIEYRDLLLYPSASSRYRISMKFSNIKSYAATISTKLATGQLGASSSTNTPTLRGSRPRKLTSATDTRKVVFSESVKRRLAQSTSPVKIHIRLTQPGGGSSGQQTMAQSQTAASVSLPPVLARPKFRDINRDIIDSIAPELVDTPTQYVRDYIASVGSSYVQRKYCLSASMLTTASQNSQSIRIYKVYHHPSQGVF